MSSSVSPHSRASTRGGWPRRAADRGRLLERFSSWFNKAQRRIEDRRWRRALGMAAALLVATRSRRPRPPRHPDPLEVAELRRSGMVRLGALLQPLQIEDIRRFALAHRSRDPYVKDLGHFSPLCPPDAANLGAYDAPLVARAPHLLALANEPRVLATVQAFLGAPPTLSGLHLWWSFCARRPRETQLFHRDVDDIRFCKLFVYLTDVDPEGGPHVFVSGSARKNLCTERRRHADQAVENAFGRQSLMVVCGRAGEAFLADTSGVHKGVAPRSRPRLIFVAQYSLFPVPARRYRPELQRGQVHEVVDGYVSRLFVR